MTSFNLTDLPKAFFSNTATLRARAEICEFGGHSLVHSMWYSGVTGSLNADSLFDYTEYNQYISKYL